MQLPSRFVERLEAQLGAAEAQRLAAALDTPPPVSIRRNPDKEPLSRSDIRTAVPWCEAGCYLHERPSFTFDPAFHAGAYYVQEASSQFVGRLLPDGIQGMRLLDLCAAPGAKTTLYASAVGPEGLVVANEIDRKRMAVLADNVRKWGTGNVVVTGCDPQRMTGLDEWFDVVAVDAPCSGEGMFRKDDNARAEWSEQQVVRCAARQDLILQEAWRMLRAGGTLIYSTCTFNREEDEGALERLLAALGEEAFETAPTVELPAAWGIVGGQTGPFQTFRFYPHRLEGEGFFAAVVRKAAGCDRRSRPVKGRRSPIEAVERTARQELSRWVRHPETMRFGQAGGTCYAWYEAQADAVARIAALWPVCYSGVALGQLFKGQLKPDPALACFVGLERSALPAAELTENEAIDYLRKQEVTADRFAEGMNLVCREGRPLGFAKRIGNRVNNLYPNGLRILKERNEILETV